MRRVRGAARLALALLLIAGTAGSGGAAPGPSASLQIRIDAAPSGAVLVLPAGLYAGPIVIEKPLSLEGEPGTVIEGPGSGDVIRITSPDVTVKGLAIRGTGISLDQENAAVTVLADRVRIEDNEIDDALFGIYLKDATDCVIRGNRIRGKDLEVQRRGDAIRIWHSRNCVIEDNLVTDARDVVIWFSENARIARNVVKNGRYGLHFMYSDSNLIEDNFLEGNSVGAFLMYSRNLRLRRNVFLRNRGPSGYGIGLKDMDGVDAEDNRMVGNRIGIYLDNSPWSVDVYDHFTRNVVAFNDIGIAFQPAVKRNVFRDNTFLENVEQVAVLGNGNFGGNDFTVEGRGNFWSDYNGYDLDEDGLGDIPYRSESLFENLMDREKKLRLFLFSPVQQAIELAAQALPVIKPRTKLTDEAPLMTPVPLRAASLPTHPGWPMGVLAAGLVLGSALALRTGWWRSGSAGRKLGRRGDETAVAEAVPGTEPVLRARALTKRFGKFRAVDQVSFDILPGEAIVLWGRNGAGKTTILRCVLGLLRFDGDIAVAGRDVRHHGKAARRCLGYVPQELSFHEDMGAIETLVFYARIKKVRTSRAAEVLSEVGLEDHGKKRVGELSGGMKQRLALAVALLADPPVLLLDELTSNLDASARLGFLELLKQQRERGKTIVFTSHRIEEVRALADRVLVLEEGKLVSERSLDAGTLEIGSRCSLSVLVDQNERGRAISVLEKQGFDPRSNGGAGIRIPVRGSEKVDVLRALEDAGLRVLDFAIEDLSSEGAIAGEPDAGRKEESWTPESF